MRNILLLALLSLVLPAWGRAELVGTLPVEQRVAEAIKSPEITLVHFWAPWCPNCRAELGPQGWAAFIAANPRVHFIFVTIWNATDGRAALEKAGVRPAENVTLLLHPNPARKTGEKMRSFLGVEVDWIPTTWVCRNGKLLYNLGYGEMRFPLLQQFVRDAADTWEH